MDDDYGDPCSYLTLAEGTAVYASDGENVGRVERVLAVPEDDIFDGIVIHTHVGSRFVDAPEVGRLYERAAFLKIASSEIENLPPPKY
jgi:hypothetical protein